MKINDVIRRYEMLAINLFRVNVAGYILTIMFCFRKPEIDDIKLSVNYFLYFPNLNLINFNEKKTVITANTIFVVRVFIHKR